MKKLVTLLVATGFLNGDFSLDGEFYACATPVFSITVDVRTLSFVFSGQTAKTSMGTFTVSITDTTTSGTNNVYLESLQASAFTSGSTIQARRATTVSGGAPLEETIDLVVENDPDDTGTAGAVEVKQDELIRTFVYPDRPSPNPEDHTIEVFSAANTLTGKAAGNYRTLLYFRLTSS